MTRIGLLVSLLFLPACAEMVTDILEYGSVEVEVVQRDGEPVPGAKLILYNSLQLMAQGVTDESGRHLFEFVPPNQYGIRLLPGVGYIFEEGRGASFIDGLWIGEGEVHTHSLTVLGCSPEIQVRVEDEAGFPVPGAGLELYTTHEILATGASGADGLFTFSAFACGMEYGVRVQPPQGYTVVEGRGSSFIDGIRLDTDEKLQITFRLQASRP